MNVVDSHFHLWPRSVLEKLCIRKDYPRAEPDGKGGYRYYRTAGCSYVLKVFPELFDIDQQLMIRDSLDHETNAFISTIGPFSLHFSDIPKTEGQEAAIEWNEGMADIVRSQSGRVWGSAAIPLVHTETALAVLDDAVHRLDLRAINLPGSIGDDPRIDAERLEPFYARAEELGVPLFLHPTDALFADVLSGYGGALHRGIGRIIEVSVAASRLIFSGIMERHPNLIVVMSHTGGALPYQAGRLDKNGTGAQLADSPSTYLRRMYTDTISPHTMGIKFAIEFFGVDHVMYGSDYPCWSPSAARKFFNETDLPQPERDKILGGNALRILAGCELVSP